MNSIKGGGLLWPWSHGSWIYNYLCNPFLSPLMWVRLPLRARCTTLCDQVCQWLTVVFSGSSTNKTNRHDITEILLKVAPQKQTKSNFGQYPGRLRFFVFLETIHFWNHNNNYNIEQLDFKIFAKTYMYNFHISNCKITMLTAVWWQNLPIKTKQNYKNYF